MQTISPQEFVRATADVSSILETRPYLMEVELMRPTSQDLLSRVLDRSGLGSVMFDLSHEEGKTKRIDERVTRMWERWIEWGGLGGSTASSKAAVRYRFIARPLRPILLRSTIDVRWILQHPMTIDPEEEADHEHTISFDLQRGHTYALRFLARMIKQPNRVDICDHLAMMGFLPRKVISVKRNTRVEGKPNTSVSRWYAVATWEKPDSVTVPSEDPFFFEHVRTIG